MCWSATASLGFGLCHLLTLTFVRRYLPQRRDYTIFLAFYAIMEFFQAAQWIWGDLLPPSEFGYPRTACTTRNAIFSFGAYFLIWVQPTIYALIASNKRHDRSLLLLSLFTLDWALFSLLLGRLKNAEPTYRVPGSNYGLSTCSEIGIHGHIGWRFAPNSVKYAPNDYVYFLLVLAGLLRSDSFLFIGWTSSLILSLLRVGASIDLPAYWCSLSVLADLPILWQIVRRSSSHQQATRQRVSITKDKSVKHQLSHQVSHQLSH